MIDLIKQIKVKKWAIFFGILLLFLYLDLFFLIGLYYIDPNLEEITLSMSLIAIFFKYFILILIFMLMYHKYLKEKLMDFVHNFKKYVPLSFRYWFIGFLIMIISNMIINTLFPGLGQNEQQVQSLISNVPIIAFILTTFFAPFIEEMIFRKYLQDAINSRIIYMIASGLIFGFVHVMGYNNPLEYLLIIPYGALGYMFAKIINDTDNIYCTIMMHMFHNGMLTLLAMLV